MSRFWWLLYAFGSAVAFIVIVACGIAAHALSPDDIVEEDLWSH